MGAYDQFVELDAVQSVSGIQGSLPELLPPGTQVGEYVVVSKIGQGGMATVYAAVHPVIGKQAAIKIMSPLLSADAGAVSRFVLEARAVNRIGHPNIVDVFSFGRLPDGRSYFVMEWLKGETLYERIWRQHGPLPLGDVIHILDEISCALEAAHAEGIVHRDLKPANVFLCNDRRSPGRVKLLDFGVAKLVHQELPPHTTAVGCVVGTPEYVSPEQARARDVTAAADLYSLGVIAYEMTLGRLPFLSDNPADAIQMHLSATPPKPRILWPDIPPRLERMLVHLLAKDAADRPSLSEVRATLEALRPLTVATPTSLRLPATPASAAAATALHAFARTRQRRLVRLVAVAVGFLLLVYLGYRPVARSAQQAQQLPALPHNAVARALGGHVPASSAAAAPGSTAVAPAVAPVVQPATVTPATPGRPAAPTNPPRRHRRRYRDANYLLDPFVNCSGTKC